MLSGFLHETRPANEGVEARLIAKMPLWRLMLSA
ncbi:hypothetical protein DES40_2533 [Litorimonas taeanensis]|uniref:Uncharacterized protein n=1 Tax=Litorimonas taeanensis TaxID=568099 RepID=A0A420WFF0_9PROT|nr:hypothetical protein DES40_2533 [Litorimonas taeanensis]